MEQQLLQKYIYSTLKETCFEVPLATTNRRRLSEKYARKRFEKAGYLVWRGGLISITRREELYPNVRKKYTLLLTLIEKYHPGTTELLKYLCDVHHGMPDFICFKDGHFRFLECKLSHESLSPRQKLCIRRLIQEGFEVHILRLVDKGTRRRHSIYDLATRTRKILEYQTKIRTRRQKNAKNINNR